jgi:hypothetical protein
MVMRRKAVMPESKTVLQINVSLFQDLKIYNCHITEFLIINCKVNKLAERIKIPGLLNSMNGFFFLIIDQRKYVPAIFRKKDK